VTPDGPRLYATDFHNNHVDVWDSSWNLVTSATFTDPSLPDVYAPFGIQRIGETIFVTYARQDAEAALRVDRPELARLSRPVVEPLTRAR